MPNHITNKLTIIGEQKDVEAVVEFVMSDETVFDFTHIIPDPSDRYDIGWCRNNWGTKWNSYEAEQTDNDSFSFLTAWMTPEPVIKQLSILFPDISIHVEYADEDFGNNCGWYRYCRGECVDHLEYINGSEKAVNFAAEILGYDPREDY